MGTLQIRSGSPPIGYRRFTPIAATKNILLHKWSQSTQFSFGQWERQSDPENYLETM